MSGAQLFRITIGLALVALVASVYVPHLFYTYSTNAVVTARLITLDAPIEGIVTLAPPIVGTELEKGDTIAVIENVTIDKSILDNLATEQKGLTEKIEALKNEKETLLNLTAELEKSNRLYSESRKQRLEYDIERAKYRLDELTDTVKQSDVNLQRKQSLFSKGNAAKSNLDSAFFDKERSLKAAEQAKLELDRLTFELSSLQKDVNVDRDGRLDVPYQKQRMDEIKIRNSNIDTQLQEASARLENINARYAAEEDRINKLAKQSIVSQGYVVIWRSKVNQGNYTNAKEEVVQVVDCDHILLDVTLHERYFDKIKPGDKVKVKLTGSNQTILGRVNSIRGGSLRPDAETAMAGVTPIRRQREIEVFVDLDPDDIRKIKGKFCGVGLTAEAVFEGLGL